VFGGVAKMRPDVRQLDELRPIKITRGVMKYAEVDMNDAMTGSGLLVEVQGTAEAKSFNKDQLNLMIKLAEEGILRLIAKQKEILAE